MVAGLPSWAVQLHLVDTAPQRGQCWRQVWSRAQPPYFPVSLRGLVSGGHVRRWAKPCLGLQTRRGAALVARGPREPVGGCTALNCTVGPLRGSSWCPHPDSDVLSRGRTASQHGPDTHLGCPPLLVRQVMGACLDQLLPPLTLPWRARISGHGQGNRLGEADPKQHKMTHLPSPYHTHVANECTTHQTYLLAWATPPGGVGVGGGGENNSKGPAPFTMRRRGRQHTCIGLG